MTFDEALKINNLGDIIDTQYGRWGHFHQEAADLIVKVAQIEDIPPELLAVTWLNESTFDMRPPPNTNRQPARPEAWDVGPLQLNILWTYKSVWIKEFRADGLHFKDVFGDINEDTAPGPFAGDPLANARMAARKLFSIRGTWQDKAVKYTGGNEARREHRAKDWNKYAPLFSGFFNTYSG